MFMNSEVVSEPLDAGSQKSNLHLCGASIIIAGLVVLDYRFLFDLA